MPTPLPQEQNQQATPLPQTAPQAPQQAAQGGDDFLRPILDPVQADNAVKSQAWNAWHASNSSEDFQKAFEGINIPRETKSQLWNLRFKPSSEQLQQMLPAYARKYGVDPELMRRVIQQESGWKQYDPSTGQPLTNAKSGAMGLTQLMPETAQRWGVDPRDPIANLQGGIQEFAQRYKESGGDLNKALAAYGGFVTKDPAAYTGAITHGYQPAQAAQAGKQAPPQARPQQAQQPGMFAPPAGFNMYQINPEGVAQLKRGLTAPGGLFGPPTAQEEAQARATAGLIGDPKNLGQAFSQVQAAPEKFMQPSAGLSISPAAPFSPVAAGMVQPGTVGAGVAESVAGLASPANILQLAAIPESKLINLFFTGQMGMDTAQALWHAKQQEAAGNQQGANELYGQALVSGGMTLLTALGLRPQREAGVRPGVRTETAQPGVSMGQAPARVQVGAQAAPSVAQEGGPQQVTQAGVTGAQEVTGGRVPAPASAPIEGAGGTTGTVTPKPFEEKRTGPQVSLPPGFERRGVKTPEQVQAEAKANLAAQTEQGAAKREAYSQQELRRQAYLRIQQDPELSKAFRKAPPNEQEALLQHVSGQQIQALQPPPGGPVPRPMRREIPGAAALGAAPIAAPVGGARAERPTGVPETPTPTPTAAAGQPLARAEVSANAPREPVRPQPGAGGQPLQQPTKVAPPTYRPLPAEQRPFVPAGGGAPRYAQPKVEAPATPTAPIAPKPETPTPAPAARADAPAREVFTSQGKEKPGAIGPTRTPAEAKGTVDATLTRHLKVEGGRLDELGKAITKERAKGPEQARQTAQAISDRGARAQSYLDSIDRIEHSQDWEKEATDILHERIPKGEVDEQTGKFIVGRKWEGEEGVKGGTRTGGLDFSATFLREANPRRAEVLGNLLGLRQREVGKPTEWLEGDVKERLASLQEQYKTLLEQTRAEGGRPSDERLAQLEKLMEGIHALRGTRKIAVDEAGHPLGPEDMVGKTGEKIPAGARVSRQFLAELMGPRWSAKGHWARPSAEQFAARRAELQNEIKWSRNTARALTEGLPGAETVTSKPAPTEAPKPTAPEAARPLKQLAGREAPAQPAKVQVSAADAVRHGEIAQAAYDKEGYDGLEKLSTEQLRAAAESPNITKALEGAIKVELTDRAEKAKPAEKTGYGEKNTVFTKDRAEAARQRLRDKLGRTSYTGLDPELLKDVSEIMGYHFEAGVRAFADLSARVVQEFGEAVRPYLKDAYEAMLRRGGTHVAKTPAERVPEPPAVSGAVGNAELAAAEHEEKETARLTEAVAKTIPGEGFVHGAPLKTVSEFLKTGIPSRESEEGFNTFVARLNRPEGYAASQTAIGGFGPHARASEKYGKTADLPLERPGDATRVAYIIDKDIPALRRSHAESVSEFVSEHPEMYKALGGKDFISKQALREVYDRLHPETSAYAKKIGAFETPTAGRTSEMIVPEELAKGGVAVPPDKIKGLVYDGPLPKILDEMRKANVRLPVYDSQGALRLRPKEGIQAPKTPAAGPEKPVEPSKPAPSPETPKPPSAAPKKGGFLRIREDVPEARPAAPKPEPKFVMSEDKALSDIANMPREVREAFYGLNAGEQKEFVQRYRAGRHPEQELLHPERLAAGGAGRGEKQEIVEQKRETVPAAQMRRYEQASAEARAKYEQARAAHQARLEEVRQLRAVEPQDYTPAYIDRLKKFGNQLRDVEGKAEFLGKVEEARTGFSTGDDKAGHAAVTSALAMADQRLLEPRTEKLFAPEVKKPAPTAPARVSTRPEAPREPGIGKRVFDAFSADAAKGLREFSDSDLRQAREQVGENTRRGIDAELAAREAEKPEIAKIAPEARRAVQAPRKGEHVAVSAPPPEGTGGKGDAAREQIYELASRIDGLPKGEDRNALAKRVNALSKTIEGLNEQLKWTNQAIRQMRASGENVRTRTNKVTGERKTETLQQLEMRVMKLGQARDAIMLEKKAPAKGVQKGAPAYDTIAAIRDAVAAFEKPALPGAPKQVETVQKPVTVMVHGHERVIDPNTGKLVEQLAPVIGEKKDVIPSPAPKEEGVQQRIEQLKKEAGHLAGLYNKFGGMPTRSAAIDINRLKKSIRAISKSIPKNLMPELPESVRAALEGGKMLEKAARAEYAERPREGEIVEPKEEGAWRPGMPHGDSAEDVQRWLESKTEAVPPAVLSFVQKNLARTGEVGNRLAQAVMEQAKKGEFGDIRGDEAPRKVAVRLQRALDVFNAGRVKALGFEGGARKDAQMKAYKDALEVARTGSLPRPKEGERGSIPLTPGGSRGGKPERGAGLEAAKRIREEREREEKGPFYNMSERVVREQWPGTPGSKQSPKDIAGMLTNAGVSRNELKWSDVDSFLLRAQKEGRQVSRQEVLDYLKEHNPKIEVTEKTTGAVKEFNRLQNEHSLTFENLKRSVRDRLNLSDQDANDALRYLSSDETFAKDGDLARTLKRAVYDNIRTQGSRGGAPRTAETASLQSDVAVNRFLEEQSTALKHLLELRRRMDESPDRGGGAQYERWKVLPGGENYHEDLLRMPARGSLEAFKRDRAALRIEGAEAKPFLENKEDYQGPHYDEPNVVVHIRADDRIDAEGKKTYLLHEVQGDWDRELREQGSRQSLIERGFTKDFVPEMPFTHGHWLELGLKYALKKAAEGGYDKIAWTTGEQQADRYNLRKQLDGLEYIKNADGSYTLAGYRKGMPMDRDPISLGRFSEQELPNVIGHGLAQALIARTEIPEGRRGMFRGVDLKVGGEHHLQLYDKMIPQFMEKYGKKWGAKVEGGSVLTRKEGDERGPTSSDYERGKWVDKDQYDKVHSMDIPEGMRGVLKQPLRLIGGSQAGVLSFGGRKAKLGAEGAISRLFGKNKKEAEGQQSKFDQWIEKMRETSDAFKAGRRLEDMLVQRSFQQQGMKRRLLDGLDDLPKVPGLQREMYRIQERAKAGRGPGFEKEVQKVFDEHIRDWADLLEQRFLQLKDAGYQEIVDQYQVDKYTPKYAIKKNTMWDRVFRGAGKWSMGSVLRETASALKGRSFYRLEAPGIPVDTIVHVAKNGELTLWDKQKPIPLGASKEEFEAQGFKFTNALTDDTTRHSGQNYLQHLYLATSSKAMELDNAWRAHEMMEAYKESPDFKRYAVKAPPGAPIPDGFEHTRVPQLQGYAFEKHTADVLDRYYKSLNPESGDILDKFNYGLITTLYMNPLKHTYNILDHFATQFGLFGGLNPKNFRPMQRSFQKAWRAVKDGNHDWFYAMDNGMPLRGKTITNEQMTARMLKEVLPMKWNGEKNTWEFEPEAEGIAKAWGYLNPKQLAKAYFNGQRKLLFGADDVLRLTATYHHMELTGASFKEAWKEVGKHLPDYTVPTHVGLRIPGTDIDIPSKRLARLFDNPLVVFGRYHYGKLKSYGYMAQDGLSKDIPFRERRRALDRLLVPAAKMAFYYYVGNKIIQNLTGKKDAEMRMSGATSLPAMILRVMQGKTTIPRAVMSEVTPNPIVDWAARLGWGTASWAAKGKQNPLTEQVKEIVGLKGDLTQPSRLKLSGGLLGEIGPIREMEQTRRGIAGQVDWGELARRNLFDVYTQKPSGGTGRGLPRLPHFPRTK